MTSRKKTLVYRPSMGIKKDKNAEKSEIEKYCEQNEVSKQELDDLQKYFKRYDQYQIGVVEWYEVDDIFRDFGMKISDPVRQFITQQLHTYEYKTPNFQEVLKVYAETKQHIHEEIDEMAQTDTINAFSALGGELDKTGAVQTKNIIEILRSEFLLDFDIEGYLEKIGLSDLDQLNYEEFSKLFENEDAREILSGYSRESKTRKQMQQKQSLSQYHQTKTVKKSPKINEDFSVDYRDFEKWDRQYNGNGLIQGMDNSPQKTQQQQQARQPLTEKKTIQI